jgi:hypothetical protein
LKSSLELDEILARRWQGARGFYGVCVRDQAGSDAERYRLGDLNGVSALIARPTATAWADNHNPILRA